MLCQLQINTFITQAQTVIIITMVHLKRKNSFLKKSINVSKTFLLFSNTNTILCMSSTAIAIDTDSCWFCLSSKNITKHMIISIGDQV